MQGAKYHPLKQMQVVNKEVKSKCVIRPALRCGLGQTDAGPAYVSAILVSTDPELREEYENETKPGLLARLRSLDPMMHRFVYATSTHIRCDPMEIPPPDVVRKCGIENPRSLTFYNSPMFSPYPEGVIPRSAHDYLIDSLKLLHANGITHGDPHRYNIGLYNGRPILFDFGKSQMTTDPETLEEDMSMLRLAFVPEAPKGRPAKRRREDDGLPSPAPSPAAKPKGGMFGWLGLGKKKP